MPSYRQYHYDVRPRRPGWSWYAYDLDGMTTIGHGDAGRKSDAERAAEMCIEEHRQSPHDPEQNGR